MKIKEIDCMVDVWTETHFKMVHIPTGKSVHHKDNITFPKIKKVMLAKLRKKMKKYEV
jgi:hypothetical protein